jgi:hypothetical protein
MTLDYYSLDAPGGRATTRGCGKDFAPKDTLEFNVEGALLLVWMHPYGKFLQFELHVPEGVSVSLAETEILLRELGRNDKGVPIFYFVDGSYKALKGLAETQFKGGNDRGFFNKHNVYTFSVEFDIPLKEEFYVTLPSIVTNTRTVRIPEIHFEKKKGFGIYPINC